MNAAFTRERNSATVCATVISGGKTASAGSIMRPMLPSSYAWLRDHWRAVSGGTAFITAAAKSRGSLILSVNASAIGLNVTAGDQYVADVLPARTFRNEFARRGLAPQVLSRAVEDSGTVTSPLVPWNTCGAYMSGVLGVSTIAYLPFCFFNLLSPLLDVLYGYLGFKVPNAEQPWEDEATTAALPVVNPGDAHV